MLYIFIKLNYFIICAKLKLILIPEIIGFDYTVRKYAFSQTLLVWGYIEFGVPLSVSRMTGYMAFENPWLHMNDSPAKPLTTLWYVTAV